MPARAQLVRPGLLLPGGDAQLQLDQVDAGDLSVTGCSTCSRVFISMKKNSSGRSPATMNSTVPAPV